MAAAPLPLPAIQNLKTGTFPHQAYRPACSCIDGRPQEVRNYARHVVAPPVCSSCGLRYRLDITLMPTYTPEQKEG